MPQDRPSPVRFQAGSRVDKKSYRAAEGNATLNRRRSSILIIFRKTIFLSPPYSRSKRAHETSMMYFRPNQEDPNPHLKFPLDLLKSISHERIQWI